MAWVEPLGSRVRQYLPIILASLELESSVLKLASKGYKSEYFCNLSIFSESLESLESIINNMHISDQWPFKSMTLQTNDLSDQRPFRPLTFWSYPSDQRPFGPTKFGISYMETYQTFLESSQNLKKIPKSLESCVTKIKWFTHRSPLSPAFPIQ